MPTRPRGQRKKRILENNLNVLAIRPCGVDGVLHWLAFELHCRRTLQIHQPEYSRMD
jgi:hypothetical protein